VSGKRDMGISHCRAAANRIVTNILITDLALVCSWPVNVWLPLRAGKFSAEKLFRQREGPLHA